MRRLSRRWNIRVFGFLFAVIAVLSGFVYKFYRETRDFKISLSNTHQKAISDMAQNISKIDISFQKVRYSGTNGAMQYYLNEASRYAAMAGESLVILPYDNDKTVTIAKFISQAGDFASALSKKLAQGGDITQEDRNRLIELSNNMSTLSLNVYNLQSDFDNNKIDAREIKFLSQQKVADGAPTFTETVTKIAEDMAEVPTLIYDGAFSEHIVTAGSDFLKDFEEISAEKAKQIAAEFCGTDISKFSEPAESDGNMPAYSFNTDECNISVSKRGGKIISFTSFKTPTKNDLTIEQALEEARKYLSSKNYDSMKDLFYYKNNNILTVEFAFTQEDVIIYTELIKVGVSMEDGSVLLVEAMNYLKNHKDERDITPEISMEDARSRVSKSLTVKSSRLAVIPTPGKYEKLCYEFECVSDDERDIMVYINAKTGVEENIVILLRTEDGTLTND